MISQSKAVNFRSDINSLRAVAVLGVIVFHFFGNTLPGGFAGVDVFFVISGYLMTGMIASKLNENRFSIVTFYAARVRRIVPALLFLCLCLMVFGWFYVSPIDFRFLSKHVVGSISFSSNVLYWMEAGYFDAASHEKWLLHTWSLSLEWQFYILYPIVLASAWRFMGKTRATFLLWFFLFLSLAVSILSTPAYPVFSFFLLPSRLWEFLVGGLVFMHNPKMNRYALPAALLGLLGIGASFLFSSSAAGWPGSLATIPVISTALIIAANNKTLPVLSHRLVQLIGKTSYSIYLWHWPIVVLMLYYEQSALSISLAGIAFSFVAGFLSWRYIEQNRLLGRNPANTAIAPYSLRMPTYVTAAVAIILCAASIFVYSNDGIASRASSQVITAMTEASNKNPYDCLNNTPCVIGNPDNIKGVVLGDSHADSLFTAVAAPLNLDTEGLVGIIKSGCPFVLNIDEVAGKYADCAKFNQAALKSIQADYKEVPIFMISKTAAYLNTHSNEKNTPLNIAGLDEVRNENSESAEAEATFSSHDNITQQASDMTESGSSVFRLKYLQTVCTLSQTHPVWLTNPLPVMPISVPKHMARKLFLSERGGGGVFISRKEYKQQSDQVYQLNQSAAAACNALVLNPADQLCTPFLCMGSKDSRPLYFDDNHLSEFGNRQLIPLFNSIEYDQKSSRSN